MCCQSGNEGTMVPDAQFCKVEIGQNIFPKKYYETSLKDAYFIVQYLYLKLYDNALALTTLPCKLFIQQKCSALKLTIHIVTAIEVIKWSSDSMGSGLKLKGLQLHSCSSYDLFSEEIRTTAGNQSHIMVTESENLLNNHEDAQGKIDVAVDEVPVDL